MKVLLVGEFVWPWYQEACAKALEKLGCEVIRFGWLDRFKKWELCKSEPVYRSFWHRLQFRFLLGPIVDCINSDLESLALLERPDVVWFYNVQLIYPETVKKLRAKLPETIFCQYSNDNPFSATAHKSIWRHFVASVPYFDLHYGFREESLEALVSHGAKNVHLLRAYFIPEDDFPLNPSNIDSRYRCDVVFAGHYEDDGRVESLEAICRAGYKLNLFGGGWNAALPKLSPDSPLRKIYPVSPVTGGDYRQAICGAKVALCFLSTLNHDTYTRRSFQIPAMKVPLLSQRTGDLVNMFNENKEMAFFSNTGELLEKLQYLLKNDAQRKILADGGYARVYRDGHDVLSRMRQWLDSVRKHQVERAVGSNA
jgi:hypothetical protein